VIKSFGEHRTELIWSGEAFLDQQHPDWDYAANKISGPGSTPARSQKIIEIVEDSAPELTGDEAKQFKDEIKQLILSSLAACQA
jgi:hypothetical protein